MNHIAYRPFLSPDAGGASAAEIPKEKKQIDQKTFSYISNFGFALLSLVAALFFSIPFFGAEGILLGVFAALQLVALLITFLNARKEKSAINLLPTLFGADLAGYMILRAGSVHALTEFLNWLVRGGIGLPRNLVVIAAGIIVVIGLFVSIKNSDIVFSMLLSLGALAALIYGCTQERTAGMRTVLALTVPLLLMWIFAVLFAQKNGNINFHAKRGVSFRRNTSFFSCLVLLSVLLYQFLVQVRRVNVSLDTLTGKLGWVAVIVIAVAAGGASFGLSYLHKDCVWQSGTAFDELFLLFIAPFILFVKILTVQPYAYGIVLFALYLLAQLLLFGRIRSLMQLRRLPLIDLYRRCLTYLALPMLIGGIIMNLLIREYLLVNALLSIPAFILLYLVLENRIRREPLTQGLPKKYHLTVMLFIIVHGFALIFYKCSATGNYVLWGILSLTALLCLLGAERKTPDRIRAPETATVRWALCLFLAVLGTAILLSSGAKISFDGVNGNQVRISVEADDDAKIRDLQYEWSDGVIYKVLGAGNYRSDRWGNRSGVMKNTTFQSVSPAGELLYVTVTDSENVVTHKCFWYPRWFE
ncbi:MAG: hypothetical protein IJK02_12330 [Clostridia bacterium]|nr:hypothetical protein [Clostridia bacterium]